MLPGMRLYLDGELATIIRLDADPVVIVGRGVDGTAGRAHPAGVTVYIGRADQFYAGPPIGSPPAIIPVSPYIDTMNGQVWFAQGDASSAGSANRWWQQQTQTHGGAVLGSRSSTFDLTSST